MVTSQGTDESAVADDEEGCSRVPHGEIDEGSVCSGDDVGCCFESLWHAHLVEVSGPTGIDFVSREALPRTDIGFDETIVERGGGHAENVADDFGRVRRTHERARDDSIGRLELLGGKQRLASTAFGEWHVGTPLPTSGDVPLGFAVPQHEQPSE